MVKKRVLLDSNVLVSASAYSGYPREVFLLALKQDVDCIISEEIVNEVFIALKEKLKLEMQEIEEFISEIRKCFSIVVPKIKLQVVRDSTDNKILEAAIEGKCEYLITGDKDLLELKRYKSIKIISAKDFLEEVTAR